jgi:hypothetical protein
LALLRQNRIVISLRKHWHYLVFMAVKDNVLQSTNLTTAKMLQKNIPDFSSPAIMWRYLMSGVYLQLAVYILILFHERNSFTTMRSPEFFSHNRIHYSWHGFQNAEDHLGPGDHGMRFSDLLAWSNNSTNLSSARRSVNVSLTLSMGAAIFGIMWLICTSYDRCSIHACHLLQANLHRVVQT